MPTEANSVPFFATNEFLNKKFPLASVARSSLDEHPENWLYIDELSRRFLAAVRIGDKLVAQDLQDRLAVHYACREIMLPRPEQ